MQGFMGLVFKEIVAWNRLFQRMFSKQIGLKKQSPARSIVENQHYLVLDLRSTTENKAGFVGFFVELSKQLLY